MCHMLKSNLWEGSQELFPDWSLKLLSDWAWNSLKTSDNLKKNWRWFRVQSGRWIRLQYRKILRAIRKH